MNTDVQFTESNCGVALSFGESSQSFCTEYSGGGSAGQGKDGASAYEIALKNGFVGSEVEWLESLHGKDGYTPVKGVDYFDGINGADGKDGSDGQPGKDGYTPVKGVDYFDGAPGKDGKDGKDGVDGDTGPAGYTPVKGVDYYTEAEKAELVQETVSSLQSEEWTFELEDGSTVTKTVVIG